MNSEKIHICIIGAGASGLMAGITAAREGAYVTMLEKKEAAGKKILATGNGHCNYTNAVLNSTCYHNNDFAMKVIDKFNNYKVIEFFKEIGIFPVNKNGYYYPASMQSSSVTTMLIDEAKKLGINIVTDVNVENIEILDKGNKRFKLTASKTIRENVQKKVLKNGKKKVKSSNIRTEKCYYKFDRVIIASGGKATPNLGSDGSGYKLSKALGHSIITPLPCLTGIKCKESFFKKLAGVRIMSEVSLYANKKKIAADKGELQFTDYGISGIPVFQISRYAAKEIEKGSKVTVNIRFLPDIDDKELIEFLNDHTKRQYMGILPDKLYYVILEDFSDKKFIDCIRNFRCTCLRVNDFDRAQATCGGINLDEVNPETMESKICKDLFFAGEILDVDGICGGYNLQWAWSSGFIAGKAASKHSCNHIK